MTIRPKKIWGWLLAIGFLTAAMVLVFHNAYHGTDNTDRDDDWARVFAVHIVPHASSLYIFCEIDLFSHGGSIHTSAPYRKTNSVQRVAKMSPDGSVQCLQFVALPDGPSFDPQCTQICSHEGKIVLSSRCHKVSPEDEEEYIFACGLFLKSSEKWERRDSKELTNSMASLDFVITGGEVACSVPIIWYELRDDGVICNWNGIVVRIYVVQAGREIRVMLSAQVRGNRTDRAVWIVNY